jgi:hypothetical protein
MGILIRKYNLFVNEHGNLRRQNWGCVINEKEIITDVWPNHIGRWKPSIGCLRKWLKCDWTGEEKAQTTSKNIQKPRESNSTESATVVSGVKWFNTGDMSPSSTEKIHGRFGKIWEPNSQNWDLEWEPAYIIYHNIYIYYIDISVYYVYIYDISTRIEPQTSDPTWKHDNHDNPPSAEHPTNWVATTTQIHTFEVRSSGEATGCLTTKIQFSLEEW